MEHKWVGSKLQKDFVIGKLSKSDIILLNEVKTDQPFSFPGHTVYRSVGPNPHRGGTAVLIKNYLVDQVKCVDYVGGDIISFQMKWSPNVVFVAV